MTLVADTRLLLVHTFPADEEERSRISDLMHSSLKQRLIIPSVVVTEYFKTAGRKIGKNRCVDTDIHFEGKWALDSQQVLLKRIIPLEELKGAWADDPFVDEAMEEASKLWKNWKVLSKKSA